MVDGCPFGCPDTGHKFSCPSLGLSTVHDSEPTLPSERSPAELSECKAATIQRMIEEIQALRETADGLEALVKSLGPS